MTEMKADFPSLLKRIDKLELTGYSMSALIGGFISPQLASKWISDLRKGATSATTYLAICNVMDIIERANSVSHLPDYSKPKEEKAVKYDAVESNIKESYEVESFGVKVSAALEEEEEDNEPYPYEDEDERSVFPTKGKDKVLEKFKYVKEGSKVLFNFNDITYEYMIDVSITTLLVKSGGIWYKVVPSGGSWLKRGYINSVPR